MTYEKEVRRKNDKICVIRVRIRIIYFEIVDIVELNF